MADQRNIPQKSFFTRAYHRAFTMGALRPHAKSLLPYLNRPGGRFVEIGARDGVKESLTPFLEKALGWKGILIEPWPHLFHRCRKRRKSSLCLNVAATEPQLRDSYIELVGLPPAASVRRKLMQEARDRAEGKPIQPLKPGAKPPKRVSYVSTNSLAGILGRANFEEHFDLMVFNLPGYEAHALEGMDFDAYKPTFLLIRTVGADVKLPHLPPYYQRITESKHDQQSAFHLFRYSDFGEN
ncbi:FkbM family methyltransferase [Pelagicoccus sp. SDUM812003]|uniref:FkbM family methyltransferase n=1 Tax=Pelagicoccus sp. SDUM812003 TaxID=3041267 RepID=UPI00280D47DE|nr:FkbM family methyltransferase [Pelagicoccus sp. SDUM812003]MDQ8202666.1 hypothetical protein [Pelagicoccus sp. SDUM812003]